jgi:hypothetical protein
LPAEARRFGGRRLVGEVGLPLANDFNSLSEVRHFERPPRLLGNPNRVSHFFVAKNSPARALATAGAALLGPLADQP